ncbi:winged helix-turn-helix transcriptional regulator [Herbaspirillum sp. AP02]|uniref:MarR family winged helix-turn-helix transcriptional regulator n=1 Tax=unclassified Herbaspirillum TaxID=2624150 RepID=UPI0015DB87DD|nr:MULTISPECIES: MarR family winged helix-turn-helix transcriptional regulator [unclassified Herbaspirillum]MBG7622441.1 winged helix-turn-helix transcriptional regulator [Herbaspirillum sp. AP02]NZD70356.1 winged helix-turn-helix transcriptional regulator [Herbaspirillum sp. AP21]
MSTGFSNDYSDAAEALRDFYIRSHRTLDKLLAGEGASLARNKMLGHIERNSPVRAADLATAFGFAPRTITEAIDALERDGLVLRTGDTSDRRVKHIALTAAGKEVLRASDPVKKTFIDGLFAALSNDEIATLTSVLGKLNGRLAELEERYSSAAAETGVTVGTDTDEPGGKRARKKG